MIARQISLTLLAMGLGSLCAAPAALAACPVTGESPMEIATLYFGRTIQGHGLVSTSDWAEFTAKVITPTFPDGFTVSDGSGQWLDSKTGKTDYDPVKILTIAAPSSPALAVKLLHVMKAYEKAYAQESVGLTTVEGCAGFDE
ncbi:DUF3574 domain-containing protein [Acidisoma silvae]|uniref:DUF3574 domain-containing protein n=1 Tax=Acidisoma silvae TaxID=2802396 RepID=A0A964DYQ4_9PROT|nr:DUF3574 domain-containing protein [Acidisoma silvae]MCB8875264.1 DUF3574 domain-containing protein [Acidisoma silvae]